MRTLGYSVMSNVLVYYNPNGTPYDAGNAEALRRDMAKLREQGKRFALAQVTQQAEQLDVAIANLANLPQSVAEMRSISPAYSRWLLPVIELYWPLETTLTGLHAEQPAIADRQADLHGISHDVERLLLSYQMTAFPNLGADIWLLDDSTVAALDKSITSRLSELSVQGPVQASALQMPVRDYRFVRKFVLDQGAQQAPNAIERYLMRAARALDTEAAINR